MVRRMGLDRETLLVAAAELADEAGLDNLTLSALAQKLGVRSPSLYNHVNGLPDLRRALAAYCMQHLIDLMRDAVIGKSGEEAILSLSASYLAFARQRPGLYEAFYKIEASDSPETAKLGEQLLNIFFRVLEPYGLGEQNTLHTIRGLRSLLHGFASLEQNNGFRMKLDLDESLHFVMRAFLKGLESGA